MIIFYLCQRGTISPASCRLPAKSAFGLHLRDLLAFAATRHRNQLDLIRLNPRKAPTTLITHFNSMLSDTVL